MNTIMRKEKKYLISAIRYKQLMEEVSGMLIADKYGLQTIRSIYYDSDHDDIIRTSLEKPVFKEKLRLRCYGIADSDTQVYMELKKKYKGIVYKRRLILGLSALEELMQGLYKNDFIISGDIPHIDTLSQSQLQVLKEIAHTAKKYSLYPKIYIAYDRVAYNAVSGGDLRVTFDKNIRSRRKDLSLRCQSECSYLLEEDNYVMEVKPSQALPLWFVKALSGLKIYPSSFSKYGRIFEKEFMVTNNNITTGAKSNVF